MRKFLMMTSTLFLVAFPVLPASAPSASAAEECTGPECSQPDQGGGHCEHEKNEQITS